MLVGRSASERAVVAELFEGDSPALYNGPAPPDDFDTDIHSLLGRIRDQTRELEVLGAPCARAVVSGHAPLTRTRDGVEELALCWLIPDFDDLLPFEPLPPALPEPGSRETRTLRGVTMAWSPRRRVAVFNPVVWMALVAACWWGWFRGADPDRAALWELALESLHPGDWTVNPLRLQLAVSRLGVDECHRVYVRACLLIDDLVQ